MNLRDTTRKIIARLKERSGHPLQVVENKKLPVYWSRRLEKPEIVNPYRSRGFEPTRVESLKIFEHVPSDVAHDYELVDVGAEVLGIQDWYSWTKYEGVK